MNLQICVPYEICPFKCPMCIATNRQNYENQYKNNKRKYLDKLAHQKSCYDDFVLTGNTDPTLNKHWLRNVMNVLQGKPIELQTKNYNLKGYNLKGLSTLSYSITDVKSYLKSWNFRKIKKNNRLVILLTKEFSFLNKVNFNSMGYNQITFKILQYSGDEKTNKWINENKLQDLTGIYEIIDKYNGTNVSVRIDLDCQESTNRYRIFREDGHLYNDWEDN